MVVKQHVRARTKCGTFEVSMSERHYLKLDCVSECGTLLFEVRILNLEISQVKLFSIFFEREKRTYLSSSLCLRGNSRAPECTPAEYTTDSGECTPEYTADSGECTPEYIMDSGECTPEYIMDSGECTPPEEESMGSPRGVHGESMGPQKEPISIRADDCRVGAGPWVPFSNLAPAVGT